MDEPAELKQRRRRLIEIEAELARLQHRHDIAMSAFLFEEATALGRAMAELDRERQTLATKLPLPPPAKPEPETGVVRVLSRPRLNRHRRPG